MNNVDYIKLINIKCHYLSGFVRWGLLAGVELGKNFTFFYLFHKIHVMFGKSDTEINLSVWQSVT